jgi:hypothetical protein
MMISSYSLDPDVLSQWRAYADDGRGFAIGFSPKLMQMPAKKLRVLYDEDRQLYEMLGNLKHTYEYEKSIGFKYDDQFQSHWFNIASTCALTSIRRSKKKKKFGWLMFLVSSATATRWNWSL